MMKSETIDNYNIKYKKHIFSKSIKVTLNNKNTILVTMPYFCPYKKARDFLLSVFNKVKNFNYKTSELSDEQIRNLRSKARKYLPQRVSQLAQEHGFKYNKLALRNQKTRFGSCSIKNNINLNICLMNYDSDVIDYVIIHELVHTRIKNHSKEFWNEVEKHCPCYKNLRKKLKNKF